MQNIRTIKFEELTGFLTANNEKSFRGNQIIEWIWKYRVTSFAEMTNLSQQLRKILSDNFFIDASCIDMMQESNDGTIKVVFKLNDNKYIEGVLIPSEKRITACISSQVGCALGCRFCATGKNGFTRNLSAGEIYDQAFLLSKLAKEKYNMPLSNIVFMGMGEPLLNYENVMKAIFWINSEKGLGWSNHRMTLSTVGIEDKIKQLADDNCTVNLALSLHSAKADVRNDLIPVAKKSSLEKLSESLSYYTRKLKQKVTIEYLLLHGINDSADDAHELVKFCSTFASKINLIEYNSVPELPFKKSDDKNAALFLKILHDKNIIVKLRKSRGKDIDAACGQLANKSKQM
jgi:23S rRNA (adenine2503-C2)-methyltransferase